MIISVEQQVQKQEVSLHIKKVYIHLRYITCTKCKRLFKDEVMWRWRNYNVILPAYHHEYGCIQCFKTYEAVLNRVVAND